MEVQYENSRRYSSKISAEKYMVRGYAYLRKTIAITALVIVMAFIFFMSEQIRDDSFDMSRQVCAVMCRAFVQDYDTLPAIEQENLISSMEFWIRKSAHCFEYMVLGILMYLTTALYIKRTRQIFWTSLVAGIVYAAGDELHQYFVPGRSCEIRDVMIDSLGMFIGVVVTFIVMAWKLKNNDVLDSSVHAGGNGYI